MLFPLFATGVAGTGGKFATGINNTSRTGGKIFHQFIPVANLLPVLLIPAAILPPVSLTPVANLHLDLRVREFSRKIQNDPNIIFLGLGEGNS
jgi:hypothetical protein